MLIILTVYLVTASILLLSVKKSKDSMMLLGLCISLMLEIGGVMILIGKKGGISQEVSYFLFFSKKIQTVIQYSMVPLNVLGYIIALGRILFPFFLLEMAIQYSMIPLIRKNTIIQRICEILPVTTLILYFPYIYKSLMARFPSFQNLLANITIIWLSIYLLTALALMLYEFFSITLKFCRRQFAQITIFLMSLSGIYILYYFQDSGQVYNFYNYYNSWNRGIGYLQISPSISSYMVLVIVNVICSILGFYTLMRFTRGTYENNKEDVVMERKIDTAKIGATMFVHSMKNQLLSSRVIFKRINQLYEKPEVDAQELREYIQTLENFNEAMLTRMEELYRCVKFNAIYMLPVDVNEVIDNAMERFHGKYPEAEVTIEVKDVTTILVDKVHFCEALYNLLINAQEAVLTSKKENPQKVVLSCHNERLYTVIAVRDHGDGMSKTQQKKIFEPFYSSKNSNSNWGMGLYYVRETVKSHLGSLRVESKEGVGSTFYILIPRYK